MKIDSYETAISKWKSLFYNIDMKQAQFILYSLGNETLEAGWTYDYQIHKLNKIGKTYL